MGAALGSFDLDYRRGGFYNWREAKWMLLLNINVRDLILWNQQNGEPFFVTTDNSEGGLVIFATVDGPSSNQPNNNYGVRVFGSPDIPLPGGIGVSADPTGVTIVTDQAIYVLGNFNRGVAGGGPPRQPASLIGDSVNVMSQQLLEVVDRRRLRRQLLHQPVLPRRAERAQHHPSRTRRDARRWINAAFLGGVDTTPLNGGAGAYNGGLENYPRFHEDWGGVDAELPGIVRLPGHARARQRRLVRHRPTPATSTSRPTATGTSTPATTTLPTCRR